MAGKAFLLHGLLLLHTGFLLLYPFQIGHSDFLTFVSKEPRTVPYHKGLDLWPPTFCVAYALCVTAVFLILLG